MASGSNITGIELDKNKVTILANGMETITVKPSEGTGKTLYYAVIKGKYYLIELNDTGVNVSKTETKASALAGSNGLTAVSSDDCIEVSVNENENLITLKGKSNIGTSTITVSYGTYSTNCTARVIATPTESSVANSNIFFSTNYGTIDIIWLSGTTNTVTDTPNEPVLISDQEPMTPVTWTYNTSTSTWSENNTNNTYNSNSKTWSNPIRGDWYEYKAVETRDSSGATTDNLTSKWANAKTANGSYFVWIPRYAYRITYYANTTSTDPTGYYDGWGLWSAENGKVKLPLDNGIETVSYNGKKYIVHPAFETNLDLGGWSTNLSGFWFAKYAMSGGSYSALTSKPNVQSKRNQNIGTQYLWGRQAKYGYNGVSETLSSNGTNYTYTSYMNSHMLKNSEWGAVSYLAHSQYGRNGNEISVNQCVSLYTGYGRGLNSSESTSATGTSKIFNNTYDASAVTNAQKYNGNIGVLSSTTGNVYGVYDMSGAVWNRVAAYYSGGSSTFIQGSSYGLSMTKEAKNDNGKYISTKYITKYGGSTSNRGNEVIYTYGKVGDATKETNLGANYNSTTTYYKAWFNDCAWFTYSSEPFLSRTGDYNGRNDPGLFCSIASQGNSHERTSFRTVLCP